MIRVLLAEDMRVLREAMTAVLGMQADIDVIGSVESGTDVLGQARELRPDAVLLDIGLPGRDGLSVAADVRRELPETKIVLLTALDKPGVVREALRLGVHGFLPKGVSTTDIVDALRSVCRGGRAVSAELVSAALETGENPLSERERDVLRGIGEGATAGDIARELYLAEGTVRNHQTAAIRKLSARNTVDAIRRAERMGWL